MKFSITLALNDSNESAAMAESIQHSKNYYLHTTVNDGKELLSVLSESETDLVILDSTLETYDALSILAFTRNLIRRPIFAVLCEYPIRNDQIFLSDAGSDLIFYKPVLCEALLRSCLPYCIRNNWENEFPRPRQIYSWSTHEPGQPSAGDTSRIFSGFPPAYYAAADRHSSSYPQETTQAVAESVYAYAPHQSLYPEVIPNELPPTSDTEPVHSKFRSSAVSSLSDPLHFCQPPLAASPSQNLPMSEPSPSFSTQEDIIENFLRSLGFPATRKGFLYLQHALKYLLEHNNQSPCGKTIYRQIVSAVEEETKETAVERAIRNSIDKTWETGDLLVLDRYFPQSQMPGNSRKRVNRHSQKTGKHEFSQNEVPILCPTNIYFMVECAKHIRKQLSETHIPNQSPDSPALHVSDPPTDPDSHTC